MFKKALSKAKSKAKTALTVTTISALPTIAMATDLAAGAKQDITFGVGSTAWFVVMVLEILAAAFLYVKTKNLAVFGGVVALMLFGNVAFGLL